MIIRTEEDAQEAIEREWAEYDNGQWWVARMYDHTPASHEETAFLQTVSGIE